VVRLSFLDHRQGITIQQMRTNSSGASSVQPFLAGGGRLSEIITALDWSKTPLADLD
jgi:hypothetical protein